VAATRLIECPVTPVNDPCQRIDGIVVLSFASVKENHSEREDWHRRLPPDPVPRALHRPDRELPGSVRPMPRLPWPAVGGLRCAGIWASTVWENPQN